MNGHHDVTRAMAAIRERIVHSTVGLSHAYVFDLLVYTSCTSPQCSDYIEHAYSCICCIQLRLIAKPTWYKRVGVCEDHLGYKNKSKLNTHYD